MANAIRPIKEKGCKNRYALSTPAAHVTNSNAEFTMNIRIAALRLSEWHVNTAKRHTSGEIRRK
jgi:hypothetical protein